MRSDSLLGRAKHDASALSSANILCVSSDAELNGNLQNTLEAWWRVLCAADVATAEAIAAAVRPALVFIDARLLAWSVLAQSLRQSASPDVAVILIISEQTDEEPGSSADDVVRIPIAPWELVTRVRLHLEMRDLRRALDRERERAEAALEQLGAMALVTARERERSNLIARLLGELKPPLSPIFLAMDVLKKTAGSHAEEIAIVDRHAHELSQLIHELLQLVHVTDGESDTGSRRINVASVVRLAVEATRKVMGERGHELVVEVPAKNLFVAAHPLRLHHVLVNLLESAAKNGDSGRISLSVEQTGPESIAFRVKHVGRNAPATGLGEIVLPFAQPAAAEDAPAAIDRAPDASRGRELVILQVLVELLGGSAEALGEDAGKFTEFVVRLPVAPFGLPRGAIA
jgi:K+-sensing histidine kinase KdpD